MPIVSRRLRRFALQKDSQGVTTHINVLEEHVDGQGRVYMVGYTAPPTLTQLEAETTMNARDKNQEVIEAELRDNYEGCVAAGDGRAVPLVDVVRPRMDKYLIRQLARDERHELIAPLCAWAVAQWDPTQIANRAECPQPKANQWHARFTSIAQLATDLSADKVVTEDAREFEP